jgi:BirA family biotin operon repressor/biotin-[acetyl-CoA-carboxylase] ligase
MDRKVNISTKDKLLRVLQEHDAEYISGQALARELKISRAAVWKGIEALRKRGLTIDGIASKGYRLQESTKLFDQYTLETALAGWKVYLHEEVDSTNRLAKQLDGEHAVVIAMAQKAGRGRLGRSFHSPIGGIYLSIRLPISFALEEAQLITSMASVAAHQAIFETSGKVCTIKWVNDLYYENKKVCGILTEGVVGMESGQLSSVVVGIGLNLFTKIPAELSEQATALFTSEEEAQSALDANALVVLIVQKLLALIAKLPDRSYLEYYRTHSLILGKEVDVWQGGESWRARVTAVDQWARLEVEDQSGVRHLLSSAEISIRLAR